MTGDERELVGKALRLIYTDDGWEEGIKILARLARVRIPSLEIKTVPVSIHEIMRRGRSKFRFVDPQHNPHH